MKKLLLLVLSLLILTSCWGVRLNPEWYPHGLGRDDIFVSRPNGKFNIGKYNNTRALIVYNDQGHDTLLDGVIGYRRFGNEVFVYTREGFCVIDEKTNTAKVLVTAEEQYFVPSGTDDPAVTYLDSIDGFSDKAKEYFGVTE